MTKHTYFDDNWYSTLATAMGRGNIDLVMSTLKYVIVQNPEMSQNPSIQQLLNSNQWVLMRSLERRLKFSYFDLIIDDIAILKKIVDWPELNSFWQDHKSDIIRTILEHLASGEEHAEHTTWQQLEYLKRAGIKWTELDTIKNAVLDTISKQELDESHRGQRLFITHIVNKIQSLIQQGRYLDITPELNQLSRTDPDEVYEIMSKIEADLAELIHGLPPQSAYEQLKWIFSVTGRLYPSLLSELNKIKTTVI